MCYNYYMLGCLLLLQTHRTRHSIGAMLGCNNYYQVEFLEFNIYKGPATGWNAFLPPCTLDYSILNTSSWTKLIFEDYVSENSIFTNWFMSVDKRMTVFEILISSKSEIKFYRSKSLADFQRFNFQKYLLISVIR